MSISSEIENLPSTRYLGFASYKQCRAFALVLSITVLIAGILVVIFYGVLPEQGAWAGYPESIEGLCEQFCESSDRCHLSMAERPPLFQPVNAWTGLVFIVVGLWPILNRFDLSTVVFLFGNVYIGVGSFMFHANLAEFWGDVDVAGIVALLGATACHGLHSVYGISWRWMVLPILILTICTNFFYPQMKSIGLYVEVQMYCFQAIMVWSTLRLLVARIRQILKRRNDSSTKTSTTSSQPPRWLAILKLVLFASFPGILFLSAFGIWLMENARVFCSPNSLIQGHGIWHICSAISVFMNWQFVDQNRLADILQQTEEAAAGAEEGCVEDETTDRTLEFSEDSAEEGIIIASDIIQFGLSSHHSKVASKEGDVEMGITSDESSLDGSEASFDDGTPNNDHDIWA